MKKRIVILLIAVLCALLSATAFAEDATGRGSLVVKGESLAAYLDGKGNLMIPGNDQAVNVLPADALISIDPYRLIFLSKTEEDTKAEKTRLVCIDLTTMKEKVLAENVHAACMLDDERLYYIDANDRTKLYAADFASDRIRAAYTAAEQLDRLFLSAKGLVATYVEDAGAVVYIPATETFETYAGSVPVQSTIIGENQVYIADGSMLYLYQANGFAADILDTNVFDYAVLNGKIYYLANTGSAVRLKVYDPATMEQKVVITPEISVQPELTASAGRLFLLGGDNVAYEVDLQSGRLIRFLTIQEPEYSNSDRYVESYSIEAMSGRLNVYATFAEREQLTFTFMEFSSDTVRNEDRTTLLIGSVPLDGEEIAWSMLEPAKPFSPLYRGSRGEAVSDIQQPLYALGYYNYYIDGIFGHRTERAIRLLQGDLGRTVNGIADEELQRLILSGTLPKYDPYMPVTRGDRGLRVTAMQQRLRDLGYLADDADGIFGPRTQQAVQLFQRENGVSVSESATRDTLVRLYAAGAGQCSSYIDLRQGDTGYRVRELNKRLRELFYLESDPGDAYTAETSEAVRRFQSQVGLLINGQASASVQQRLFVANAQEFKGYIPLSRGNENDRVVRLQRRLKELNYFSGSTTGYFGKATQEAVTMFQQKVGMRPTGVATVDMQELLFSPNAPKYVKPTVLGAPVVTINCFEKRDNGVYYLTDRCSANGYVTFGWKAEGEVASYHIAITDNYGAKYIDQDTLLTMTSVSIGALSMDRTYTLEVTAYPKDGNTKHITRSALRFARMETPKEPDPTVVGTITNVVTSIETVSRMANDVYYLYPGTVTFRWYAEGDVASYYVEIRDSKNKLLLKANTVDEQAGITSDYMAEGEVYTLNVYAIPTNGIINDATLKTQRFALDDRLKPVPTVKAPVVTVENVKPDSNGVYVLDDKAVTFRWNNVKNAEQYYIEIRDAANAFFASETTTANGYVLNPASMTPGASYVLYVTAIPERGTVDQGSTTAVYLKVKEDETIIQLDAPVLSIVGAQPSSDGIAYVDSAAMTFQWTAVNGASAYNVVVRDSNNSVCTEVTVANLMFAYDAGSLARGAVYSVSVTAIPQEGVNAQGTPRTLPFIIRPEEKPEELPVAPLPTTPAATEAPAEINSPQITIEFVKEIIDSVHYVQEGMINFGWHSEGGAPSYIAEILDKSNMVLTKISTDKEGASIHTDNLAPGEIYTLRVTALPANGNVDEGKSAEIRFAKPAAEVPATPVPTAVPTPEPTIVPTAEPTAEPTAAPTAEPTAEPTEVPVANITAPVLDIQPAAEIIDSVVYVSGDRVAMNWASQGNVAGYHIEVLLNDGVIAKLDTVENSAGIPSGNLIEGMVYKLRVTAIPVGGSMEDGIVSEKMFGLMTASVPVVEATSEPSPIPTVEPTIEPSAVPTAELTPEPTFEPTAVPTAEPTVEPTPEPTAEPTPEPTAIPIADISAPVIDVQPLVDYIDSIAWVNGDSIAMSWYSEGDVAGYRVEILDQYGVCAALETMDVYAQLPSGNLVPGNIYTLRVAAIPTGGTIENAVISEQLFALMIPATPEPTIEPTMIPTPEPTLEPTVEPTAIPTPEPSPEPTAEPTEEPTPVPTEEPTPEPTAEPTPEPLPEATMEPIPEAIPVPPSDALIMTIPSEAWMVPLDMNSDPMLINALQMRLAEWGWLTPDTVYEAGILDDPTAAAIYYFQDYYNMTVGGMLTPITPEERIVGTDTLAILTNLIGEIYLNPAMVVQ